MWYSLWISLSCIPPDFYYVKIPKIRLDDSSFNTKEAIMYKHDTIQPSYKGIFIHLSNLKYVLWLY